MTKGYRRPDALVTTDWLAERLSAPDIRVVDASWYLPGMGRDGKAEHTEAHIPGAVYFDIDAISDTATDLPHMLPDPAKFSASVRALGLGDGNRIVVYDGLGVFSAARVWWMFRYFGHNDVSVLDGGFAKWRAEGRPVEAATPSTSRERHFTARVQAPLLRDLAQVRRASETGSEQILDARPADRFRGAAPEPRPSLHAGHIPGSANLPFTELIDPDTRELLDADSLRTRFEAAGIDLSRPVVTTCGSGVSASALALALHLLGHDDVSVYDGSWAEWGNRKDVPVETG